MTPVARRVAVAVAMGTSRCRAGLVCRPASKAVGTVAGGKKKYRTADAGIELNWLKKDVRTAMPRTSYH
jgi:hypothetical protein